MPVTSLSLKCCTSLLACCIDVAPCSSEHHRQLWGATCNANSSFSSCGAVCRLLLLLCRLCGQLEQALLQAVHSCSRTFSGPTPRPSLISMVMERDTTSREAKSLAVGAYLETKHTTHQQQRGEYRVPSMSYCNVASYDKKRPTKRHLTPRSCGVHGKDATHVLPSPAALHKRCPASLQELHAAAHTVQLVTYWPTLTAP